MAHRPCNFVCFLIGKNVNVLIFNMEYAIRIINCRLLILASAQTCLSCPDRRNRSLRHNVKLLLFDHKMAKTLKTAYITMMRLDFVGCLILQ